MPICTPPACCRESLRFLYRCNDLSLSNGARLFVVGANTGKRARANQSAGPRSKVLRREALTHHFLYVLIDVSSPDIHELVVSVLILEDLFCWMFQQSPDDSSNRAVSKLPVLIHLALAGECKLDQITFHFNVLWSKGR